MVNEYEPTPVETPEIIQLSELEANMAPLHSETPPGFYSSEQQPVKVSTVEDFKLPSSLDLDDNIEDEFQFGSVGIKETQSVQSSPWLEANVPIGEAPMWPNSIVSEPGSQDMPSIALYNNKAPLSSNAEASSQKSIASAPPGLEINNSIKPTAATPQNHRQQRKDGTVNQVHHQHPPPHHYLQSSGPASRGVQMSSGEMGMGIPMAPYPYAAPGFDGMAPPQYPQQHMYSAAQVNTGGSGNNSSSSASSAPPQYQATPPGMTASYPFSGNPYYAGQYFYPGAQAPFYYSQPGGRGIYPPAQYPGASQAGYPDMYGPAALGMGNQFSEGGPYGVMPLHQVPMVGSPPQAAHSSTGAKNTKGMGTAGNNAASMNTANQSAGSSQPSGTGEVSHQFSGSYGYPREGWMIPQHAWGPMMPFGAAPTNPTPGVFAPPTSMPQSGRPEGNARANSSGPRSGPAGGSNGTGWSS